MLFEDQISELQDKDVATPFLESLDFNVFGPR